MTSPAVNGQTQLADTIPLPQPDRLDGNVIRSSPPPNSLTIRVPMSDIEDTAVDVSMTEEQAREINRPPRSSSEVVTAEYHDDDDNDENEVNDQADMPQDDDEDPDWAPTKSKKATTHAKGNKADSKKSKTKDKRPSIAPSAGQARARLSRGTSTTKTARLSNANPATQKRQELRTENGSPRSDPYSATLLTDEPIPARRKEDQLDSIGANRTSKEKAPKKAVARVPKKSFYDKQELVNTGVEVDSDFEKPTRKMGDTGLSQEPEPPLKPAQAQESRSKVDTTKPRANQGTSRAIKAPLSSKSTNQKMAKVTSGDKEASPKKTSTAALPTIAEKVSARQKPLAGSNQRRKRSPISYGSASRRLGNQADKMTKMEQEETQPVQPLPAHRIVTEGKTASKTAVKTNKVTKSQRTPFKMRTTKSIDMGNHSAAQSELQSDPISDDNSQDIKDSQRHTKAATDRHESVPHPKAPMRQRDDLVVEVPENRTKKAGSKTIAKQLKELDMVMNAEEPEHPVPVLDEETQSVSSGAEQVETDTAQDPPAEDQGEMTFEDPEAIYDEPESELEPEPEPQEHHVQVVQSEPLKASAKDTNYLKKRQRLSAPEATTQPSTRKRSLVNDLGSPISARVKLTIQNRDEVRAEKPMAKPKVVTAATCVVDYNTFTTRDPPQLYQGGEPKQDSSWISGPKMLFRDKFNQNMASRAIETPNDDYLPPRDPAEVPTVFVRPALATNPPKQQPLYPTASDFLHRIAEAKQPTGVDRSRKSHKSVRHVLSAERMPDVNTGYGYRKAVPTSHDLDAANHQIDLLNQSKAGFERWHECQNAVNEASDGLLGTLHVVTVVGASQHNPPCNSY